jgi:hypothetical protein
MFNFFKLLIPKSNEVVDANGIVQAHQQTENLQEVIYYPSHAKRGAETPEFEATKRTMIAAGIGCAICGVLNTTESPLEGHHVVAEWALQNAVDFNKIKKDFPNTTATDVDTFINGPNGIILLCAEHHRAPKVGIHMTTFPAWIFQRYADDNWSLVNGPNVSDIPLVEDDTWYPKH